MMSLQARKWESIVLVIFTLGLVITFISAPLDCLRKREKKSESILIGSSGVGSWTAITTTNAPEGRWEYTTVWTGTEMIIWSGGNADFGGLLNTGAKYNPFNNTWTQMTITDAPLSRWDHSAVWTGTEVIIWGGMGKDGNFLQDGAKYNPATDTWIPTTLISAPPSRRDHSAVWTETEMIIWGGGWTGTNYPNDGAKYSPR